MGNVINELLTRKQEQQSQRRRIRFHYPKFIVQSSAFIKKYLSIIHAVVYSRILSVTPIPPIKLIDIDKIIGYSHGKQKSDIENPFAYEQVLEKDNEDLFVPETFKKSINFFTLTFKSDELEEAFVRTALLEPRIVLLRMLAFVSIITLLSRYNLYLVPILVVDLGIFVFFACITLYKQGYYYVMMFTKSSYHRFLLNALELLAIHLLFSADLTNQTGLPKTPLIGTLCYFSLTMGVSSTFLDRFTGILISLAMVGVQVFYIVIPNDEQGPQQTDIFNDISNPTTGMNNMQIQQLVMYLLPILGIFVTCTRPNEKERRLKFLKSKFVGKRLYTLSRQRQKTDFLLTLSLPKAVWQEMRDVGMTDTDKMAKRFASTTIMFVDIKNFKNLVKALGNMKDGIILMNEVFTRMGDLMDFFPSLEKIKTINTKVLFVGGLDNSATHLIDMVLLALQTRELFSIPQIFQFEDYEIEQQPCMSFGIETGPISTGIVGNKKFCYEVYGNTVNVASRMLSQAQENQVMITETVYKQIKHLFDCESLGERFVKGRGMMEVYIVHKPFDEIPETFDNEPNAAQISKSSLKIAQRWDQSIKNLLASTSIKKITSNASIHSAPRSPPPIIPVFSVENFSDMVNQGRRGSDQTKYFNFARSTGRRKSINIMSFSSSRINRTRSMMLGSQVLSDASPPASPPIVEESEARPFTADMQNNLISDLSKSLLTFSDSAETNRTSTALSSGNNSKKQYKVGENSTDRLYQTVSQPKPETSHVPAFRSKQNLTLRSNVDLANPSIPAPTKYLSKSNLSNSRSIIPQSLLRSKSFSTSTSHSPSRAANYALDQTPEQVFSVFHNEPRQVRYKRQKPITQTKDDRVREIVLKSINSISGDSIEEYMKKIEEQIDPYYLFFKSRILEGEFRSNYCTATWTNFLQSVLEGLGLQLIFLGLGIVSAVWHGVGVTDPNSGFYGVLSGIVIGIGGKFFILSLVGFHVAGTEDLTASFRTRIQIYYTALLCDLTIAIMVSLPWSWLSTYPLATTYLIPQLLFIQSLRTRGVIFKKSLVASVCCLLILLIIQVYYKNGNLSEYITTCAFVMLWSLIMSRIEKRVRVEFMLDLILETQRQTSREEISKSADVLSSILPKRILLKLLVNRNACIYEEFKIVTVLHLDIAGFTDLSSDLEPLHIIRTLNTLFTYFDKLTEEHCIEKITTIGDAYVACSNLSSEETNDPKEGAINVCLVALQMQLYLKEVLNQSNFVKKVIKKNISVRIGIHSGPAIGAIVGGPKKFRYDLLGDTVINAEKVQEYSPIGAVSISSTTAEMVSDYHAFRLNLRTSGDKSGLEAHLLEITDPRLLPDPGY